MAPDLAPGLLPHLPAGIASLGPQATRSLVDNHGSVMTLDYLAGWSDKSNGETVAIGVPTC